MTAMSAIRPPEISRDRPGLFVFLIDQSLSMAEPFLDTPYSKAQAVAYTVNQTIHNLILNCMPYGEVEDYYHLAALGYGGSAASLAFEGKLDGLQSVPAKELAAHPLRIEKSADGSGDTYPVWVAPTAKGMTPMCQALARAKDIVDDWAADFGKSMPPIVLNISDGEANDGDPRPIARELRNTGTAAGGTLLFNLCLTSRTDTPQPYPASSLGLDDEYGRVMFDISSVLPPYMGRQASNFGYSIQPGARGFVYNGDMISLVQFLTIGTMTANRR